MVGLILMALTLMVMSVETTLRDIETGERHKCWWPNKLVDEETGHFAADGITATRVGEYFYKRDMTDTEWSNLISQYSNYEDELPDGTLENAGVVNIKLELRDNDGDGDYSQLGLKFGLMHWILVSVTALIGIGSILLDPRRRIWVSDLSG